MHPIHAFMPRGESPVSTKPCCPQDSTLLEALSKRARRCVGSVLRARSKTRIMIQTLVLDFCFQSHPANPFTTVSQDRPCVAAADVAYASSSGEQSNLAATLLHTSLPFLTDYPT